MYKNEEPKEEAEGTTENHGDEAFSPQPSDDSEFGAEEHPDTELHNEEGNNPELHDEEDESQCEVIGIQPITVAASIKFVTTCLTQLCTFLCKSKPT